MMHHVSLEALYFINKMTNNLPHLRPTIQELLSDEYFKIDLSRCNTIGKVLTERQSEVLNRYGKIDPASKMPAVIFDFGTTLQFQEFYSTFRDKPN